jgi:hypothetical protein
MTSPPQFVFIARRQILSKYSAFGVLALIGLIVSGCGGSSPSAPSAPTPTSTPTRGTLSITVTPSPVAFSGTPTTLAGCSGSPNTWHWTYVIREIGGVEVTIAERINLINDVETSREGSIRIPANGTVEQAASACAADGTVAYMHTTRFVGTDARDNPISVTVPAFQLAARDRFRSIDIEPVANASISHLRAPTGRQVLGGVPFDFRSGERAVFHTQHALTADRPVEAILPISVGAAQAVHIILTGSYVVTITAGRTVGDITLAFASGATLTVPIVAWSNIREEWHYTDEPLRAMTSPPAPASWDNVLEQAQGRAGRPAVGVLDRLRIQIPDNLSRVPVVSLRIRDTSATTAQSLHPALTVSAITFETR